MEPQSGERGRHGALPGKKPFVLIYLLLSILSSSILFVIFKLYGRYHIDTLQAIIFNYFIAFSAGLIIDREPGQILEIMGRPWFPGVVILGFLFIAIFYLTALTTQKNGLSVVSVATKMSVAIPVLFGILLYDESTGILKISGILLAFIALYLTSSKTREKLVLSRRDLLLPFLVFLGSGIIDTSLKFLESTHVGATEIAIFSSAIFGIAGCTGILVLIIKAVKGNLRLSLKALFGGVVLGIPNFCSIYFLVLALRTNGMESSTLFPMNNMGIVMVSTILGITIFHEKMSRKNWWGVGIAIISIIMIATAEPWTK